MGAIPRIKRSNAQKPERHGNLRAAYSSPTKGRWNAVDKRTLPEHLFHHHEIIEKSGIILAWAEIGARHGDGIRCSISSAYRHTFNSVAATG